MQSQNTSFDHLGIAPKMLEVLDRLKFKVPTPIQYKAIPIALEGKDLVGIAQTGTGKTLAFGIPTAQRLAQTKDNALILVPTRELAIQVAQALQPILSSFNLTSVVLIGGAPIYSQIKALRKKPSVIVATPGRLIDHLGQRTVSLKQVHILILDEADRMFDMGFAPQVREILKSVPRVRQTLLFSATMPADIVKLATQQMKLPIRVEIAASGTAPEKVTQELFIVKEETKKAVVKMLLSEYRGSVLLFTRTKIKAKRVTRVLRDKGFKAVEIHSDRTMGQRKQAIEGFKSGQYRILVATDIAARGIDVKNIELVINYDLPDDAENYIHRIGRTARAGHAGHAVSFATPDQGGDVASIERMMKKSLPRAAHPEYPPHQFIRTTRSFSPRGRGGGRSRRLSKAGKSRRGFGGRR